mgnify:CR=1 FL=1
MKLKIVNLEGVYYSKDVDYIVIKTLAGELTILEKHLPLITVCEISILKIKKDGVYQNYALAGGILFVEEQEVKIMTSAIESEQEIDYNRAMKAKQRAIERLKDSKNDIKRAEVALKRAINRLSLMTKE